MQLLKLEWLLDENYVPAAKLCLDEFRAKFGHHPHFSYM
jgi:hypothetical protein